MADLHRRRFLGALAGAGLLTALPKAPMAWAEQAGRPDWAIGWSNPSAHELSTASLRKVHGNLPQGLSGTLYRNGPGIFTRGNQSVDHWFDGEGMMQAFRIGEGQVSHLGRMTQTETYKANEAEGRIGNFGFGTKLADPRPVTGPDSVNVANTGVLPMGDNIWALWEGGSAFAISAKGLESNGVVSLSKETQGLPFSAHPKIDRDGTIWNFGQDVHGNRLVIFKLSRDGKLQDVSVVNDVPGGMIHDFCITESSLVFMVPSLRAVRGSITYLGRFEYQEDAAQRVIVLDKNDYANRRDFELPPGFQFHFGNAYEAANGDIHFSYCAGDVGMVQNNARQLLRGELGEDSPTKLTQAVLRKDGRAEILSVRDELSDHEFPQFNPNFIGQRARYLYTVGSSQAGRPGQSAIVKHDLDTGDVDRFDYGAKALVEEHIFVPNGTGEDEGWLIGTHLDYGAKVTRLSVLDAKNLSAGPVAMYDLLYALPLGFHGAWAGE